MNNTPKFFKTEFKNKKKNNTRHLDEETVSFREVKREREHKQYRNYDNALRSKNLDRLLSYDDE
jgi:hypothetical protein